MLDISTQEEDRGQGSHGGDLAMARRAFPAAPEPWLDLSTGINPFSYPVPELPGEAFTRLPEPAALLALEEAARRAYRVPERCYVVAAPGSQALIGLLPRLLSARRIGILGFTYSEHAAAWRGVGAVVTAVEDLAALEHMDVAVVVNPNNPDGRLVPVDALLALAEKLGRRGGWLVVDEAFVDFLDVSDSLTASMPDEGVVVLRSFGKTYGLPGLRLGFAIASTSLAARLRQILGPWPVSGPALVVASGALADEAWLVATREKLEVEAAGLDRLLAAAGFSAQGGSPLFRLVEHPHATNIYAALGRAGILVRRFAARPSLLRFGIPVRAGDRSRLAAALGCGFID